MSTNVIIGKWVKYIPLRLADEYRNLGWEITDSLAGTPHGQFSCIGIWHGDEDPPLPEEESGQRER